MKSEEAERQQGIDRKKKKKLESERRSLHIESREQAFSLSLSRSLCALLLSRLGSAVLVPVPF